MTGFSDYLLSEWLKIPFYIERKVGLIFNGDNIRYVIDLRTGGISRLFYNKILILINEFFRMLSFFSPKHYLVHDALVLLFPFWVLAIIKIVREKKLKYTLTLSALGFFAFLVDQRNIVFLFPMAIVYIYLICEEIYSLLRRF